MQYRKLLTSPLKRNNIYNNFDGKTIAVMKETPIMIYKKVLENRLVRKKDELSQLESLMTSGSEVTPVDRRKFIELKAIVNELENCIDIAESMCKMEKE